MEAPRATVSRAVQLAKAADEASVAVRLLGGVGVAALLGERCPQSCRREPGDIDVAAPSRERKTVTRLIEQQGFAAHSEFNALHGRDRLLFSDTDGLKVDVVLDVLRMCHAIPLAPGFETPGPSLPAWLLLVSKLQVVEQTAKDRTDIAALLAGCRLEELEPGRIAASCGEDWGLWRTLTGSLRGITEQPPPLAPAEQAALASTATALLDELERAPKGLRWRMRSRIGERVRWYELPESP